MIIRDLLAECTTLAERIGKLLNTSVDLSNLVPICSKQRVGIALDNDVLLITRIGGYLSIRYAEDLDIVEDFPQLAIGKFSKIGDVVKLLSISKKILELIEPLKTVCNIEPLRTFIETARRALENPEEVIEPDNLPEGTGRPHYLYRASIEKKERTIKIFVAANTSSIAFHKGERLVLQYTYNRDNGFEITGRENKILKRVAYRALLRVRDKLRRRLLEVATIYIICKVFTS